MVSTNCNITASHYLTIIVVLYNCLQLADLCTVCLAQNIDTGFNCGWCSTGSCLVESECQGTLATESGSCEDPVITGFTPTSGPPQGGTIITISGTNLGVKFSDIVSITIGNRECTPIEESYTVGTQIQCTVSSSGPSSNDAITITISSSTDDKTATSTDQYMFSTPSISSIFPSLGPRSGGTRITITGSNLNIGNTDQTRIILRESSGKRRKRQGCPDSDCIDIE